MMGDVGRVSFRVKPWIQATSWLTFVAMAAMPLCLGDKMRGPIVLTAVAMVLFVASFAISYARIDVDRFAVHRRSLIRSRRIRFSEVRSANLVAQMAAGFGGWSSPALQLYLSCGDSPSSAALMVHPDSWHRSAQLIDLIKHGLENAGLEQTPSASISRVGRRNMNGLEWHVPSSEAGANRVARVLVASVATVSALRWLVRRIR
jgi:hypothetical protein